MTIITPDLHSLGFDATDRESLVLSATEFVRSAGATGGPSGGAGVPRDRARDRASGGSGSVAVPASGVPASYRCYDDPSGARLLMWDRPAGPGSAGGRTTATVAGLYPAEGAPLLPARLVRVHGEVTHVDLYTAEGDVVARFFASCDDARSVPEARTVDGRLDLYGEISVPQASVTAVSVDTNVFVDEASFRAAAREAGEVPVGLVCPSLFRVHSTGDPEDAEPCALVSGEVLSSERVTNSLTGVDWYRTVVDAAVPLTLALPADLPVAPLAGTWIAGYVKMCVGTGNRVRGKL